MIYDVNHLSIAQGTSSSMVGSGNSTHAELAGAESTVVRQAIRQNEYAGHTAGLCDGQLQCNLVILPQTSATDFYRFCEMNSVFCPVLAKTNVGQYTIDPLGEGIDLRTDLPLYNVYKHGQLVDTALNVTNLWQDDFVAFAIGCSFTFERALLSSGIRMRHIEQDVTVPMYKTNIETERCGAFGGHAVVSMRPIKESDIDKTKAICKRYKHAHGAPIHFGNPEEIGIVNLNNPNWGSAVAIEENEIPAFWGCGVTSQVAVANAAPAVCITHAPGAMLITELDELSNSDWSTAGPPDE